MMKQKEYVFICQIGDPPIVPIDDEGDDIRGYLELRIGKNRARKLVKLVNILFSHVFTKHHSNRSQSMSRVLRSFDLQIAS